jgi:hypothetical protein
MIRNNPPNSIATAQGHLDQSRQGIDSTQLPPLPADELDDLTSSPSNAVHMQLLPINPSKHSTHIDLTGRFPVTSYRGNAYVLVMVNEDSNFIHLIPMKNRTASAYTQAILEGYTFFTACNNKPHFIKMDNELSNEAINLIKTKLNLQLEVAPPHNHRTNRAERAIRTFKNHFISILCTASPSFPLEAWDELIPQCELTLNLLRPSRQHPTQSSWHHLHGPFDYNKHPLAPAGTAVLIHEKPDHRRSWSPHGVPGFYLGPSLTHYRCFRVWSTNTHAVRISDTLSWHPHNCVLPGASPTALLTAAIDDLALCLQALIASEPNSETFHATVPQLTAQLLAFRDIFHPVRERPTEVQRVPAPTSQSITFPIPPIDVPTDTVHETTPDPVIPPPPNHPTDTSIMTAPAAPDPSPDDTARPRRAVNLPQRYANFAGSSAPTSHIPTISYSQAMRGPDKQHWELAAIEEFTRLIDTTSTMRFIEEQAKPPHRLASYYNPQLKIKVKDGQNIYRVRGTYGGNKSDYPGIVTSSTADITTCKILLNAVVSEDADWMTADIADFYLGTPLARKEYMRISSNLIPLAIQQRYNLQLDSNATALVEINKGIYGLPQAGKLAQDRLIHHLTAHGYHPTAHTPCLFRHETRPVAFTLVVDDFGIKYSGKENADHFLATLRLLYNITVDWTGASYIGININYNKPDRVITLTMPNYVQNALQRFHTVKKPRDTLSPTAYVAPSFGPHQQLAINHDDLPELEPQRKLRIQQIVGVFLYYARAVDVTMLCPLNKIATHFARPTAQTEQAAEHFLQYAASLPHAAIRILPSNMQLNVHSDASYNSESKGRSRAAGIQFLGSYDHSSPQPPNGSVDAFSSIIDVVVSSATEAELAAIFMNSLRATNHRQTLLELGYPQQPTTIISDNRVGVELTNEICSHRRSRSMDMRYYWIRDRIRQKQFDVKWLPGANNLADLLTKTHPTSHYSSIRSKYVTDMEYL